MAQNFFIKQNSTLPVLRMAPIDDGRYDFQKNYELACAAKNATATFSMVDAETGAIIISREKAEIKLSSETSCNEVMVLEYDWKERDVKRKGTFYGHFEINFNGDLKGEGYDFPNGKLIVPITDELVINII